MTKVTKKQWFWWYLQHYLWVFFPYSKLEKWAAQKYWDSMCG